MLSTTGRCMSHATRLLKTPSALERMRFAAVTRKNQDVFTRKTHTCIFPNKIEGGNSIQILPRPKLRVSHTRERLEENTVYSFLFLPVF